MKLIAVGKHFSFLEINIASCHQVDMEVLQKVIVT